jgi:neutral ceramidase
MFARIVATTLAIALIAGYSTFAEAQPSNSAAPAACDRPAGTSRESGLDAGVGIMDITPTEPVVLAGSPTILKSSSVSTRLYVKALVLSSAAQKVAIVTLDTLKYPVEHVVEARQQIEKTTGIPAGNVIICASHTHRGPLWSYYKDNLVTPIAEAVALAQRELTPCRLGTAKGKAEGVSLCRRVIKDGTAWNRWQLDPAEARKYPAEGRSDPELDLLAMIGKDGRYKAIVYNFACHAANARDLTVSADYPGDVQQYVQKHLGYEVPALFLAGACGDVNPDYDASRELFGEKLGGEIMRCLGQLEPITEPSLAIESREMQMPGREHPELKEAEIALKWPRQLEHYKTAFIEMKRNEQPSYQFFLTGIRIGDDFAIVTNPNELFCEIGMSIKKQSPFKHTMVAEQTNGAHGYVPTAKAFAGGSYETWFGEHSYLTTRAGEIIEKESLDILNRLKSSE